MPLPTARPSTTRTGVKFVLGVILIVGNLTQPGLGLNVPASAEGFGFLVGVLFSYVAGGWLLYSAYKAARA